MEKAKSGTNVITIDKEQIMKCPVCGMEAEDLKKHDQERHPGEMEKMMKQQGK